MNAKLKVIGNYLRRNWQGIVGWFIGFTALRSAIAFTVDRINEGTASQIEVLSAWTMSIAFLSTIAAGLRVLWKYRIYRMPDRNGHKANGASMWLFARDGLVYTALAILSGILFGLSVLAMFVPEPVRPQVREQNNLIGIAYIVLAVLVAGATVANLWIGVVAFRRYGGKRR